MVRTFKVGTLSMVLLLPRTSFSQGKDLLAPFMTFRGVTLNATRLDGVAKKLGPAEIKFNEMDAAGSTDAMCYVGADGTFLGLASDDEMAWPYVDEIVLSHTVEPLGWDEHMGTRREWLAEAKAPRCSHVAWLSATTELGGIHLGSSEERVRQRLGPPDEQKGSSVLIYSTTVRHKQGAPESEKFFRSRFLEITLEAGEVTCLKVIEGTAE